MTSLSQLSVQKGKGETISLSLLYPPSANKLWRAVNGRNIKAKPYRDWITAVHADQLERGALRGQLGKIAGAYVFHLVADRPDRRRRDVSNLLKACEDYLVQAGVIADDSNAAKITLEWSDRPAGEGARVHVAICPLEALS